MTSSVSDGADSLTCIACTVLSQGDGGATPGWAAGETPAVGATPALNQRSRWDETPAGAGVGGATPAAGATPGATPGWGATPGFGVTPVGGLGMETPDPSQLKVLDFACLGWLIASLEVSVCPGDSCSCFARH